MAQALPGNPASTAARIALGRVALSNHLAQVIGLYGINCVLDVGAHDGTHGNLLRQLGYEGAIVSFEPVASSFAELERAMEARPPWAGHRLALGAELGSAEIKVYPGAELSSFRELTDAGREILPGTSEVTPEQVEVRRLDDLFEGLVEGLDEPRVMLKLDTQGFEWEVLDGAEASLDKLVAVQFEGTIVPLYEGVRPYEELVERMRRAGFELSGIFPVNHDERLRLLEVDCVMVRPG